MIEDELIPRLPRDAASEFERVISEPINTNTIDAGTISFFVAPKPVGTMEIVKGFFVAGYKRPAWLHRTAMRLLLGWTWKDA